MKVPLLAAMLCLGAACGSPSVIKAACAPITPQELNEPPACLGPPVTDTGLQACAVGTLPTGDEVPVCLISPEGRIFRAFITPSATIRGAGWTHSAYGGSGSTLTAADLARCAKVLPADAASVATCP